MILAGVLLSVLGAVSLFLSVFLPDLFGYSYPVVAAISAAVVLLGSALTVAGALRRRTTKVFDVELDKMSDEEVMQTVKEIEAIKDGNSDTFVGMMDEVPLAETKAELEDIVDRYSEKMAVSRQTVMTVLKHSRKVRKLRG